MTATIEPRVRDNLHGKRTRQKLIEAGVEIFGRYNFEATSTRMLKDRAGVNLAAIPYHFTSKEGLYHAVVRHIVEREMRAYVPLLAEINKRLEKSDFSDSQCFDFLSKLLNAAVLFIVGTPEAKSWARVMLREQMEPTKAFDIMYEGLIGPVFQCCLALVARILNRSTDDPETVLRVIAILAQILMFHTSREVVVRSLNWEGYSPQEIETVQRTVVKQARVILGIPENRESDTQEGRRRDEKVIGVESRK